MTKFFISNFKAFYLSKYIILPKNKVKSKKVRIFFIKRNKKKLYKSNKNLSVKKSIQKTKLKLLLKKRSEAKRRKIIQNRTNRTEQNAKMAELVDAKASKDFILLNMMSSSLSLRTNKQNFM